MARHCVPGLARTRGDRTMPSPGDHAMLTVHHLENSRSQRVLWLLEELGVPYELRRYARDPKTMLAPPELQRVHPLGKSPVITDGELTLAESGAILEYLADRYGGGVLAPLTGRPAYQRAVERGGPFHIIGG